MGKYTQSIREILQANKTSQQKLTNVGDVYDIAMNTLFDEVPSDIIDQRFQEPFYTGFTLHFMNDELGLETLPLWKIALNEKIYNSGSYINKIFDNLDKEIFANYQVRNIDNSGSTSNEKTGAGTVTNVREDATTTTTSDDVTHNTQDVTVTAGTVAGTGSITNAKTGTDTLLQTGTNTNAKSGTDTLARTGTDANAKTGKDTLNHTGTSGVAHTGTQGVAGTNQQTTNNTGHTDTDHNLIQINSDTPMGSLSNLRSPGGDAKGTGVGYANGQTYNYMSSATELDESNVQTDATTQSTSGSDSSTTTFNDTNTETRNLQDEQSYGSTDTRTLNLSDVQEYDSSTTDTRNLTDTTTYANTNTETRNTTDTTNKTDTVNRTGTDARDVVTSVDGSVTDTQTRDTTDTESGTHEDSTEEVDYSLNWEMLYKSMPLLNKVWEIFDDLFMIIF